MIHGIKPRGYAELPEVIRADRIAGLDFRAGERGPIIAITTSNSVNVKPEDFLFMGGMGVEAHFRKSSRDSGKCRRACWTRCSGVKLANRAFGLGFEMGSPGPAPGGPGRRFGPTSR
jgi:hypothetical protein